MALVNNIIEIQEFTLTAGLTDIIYSTSDPLPNALIGIYCDTYGVYPADVKKENNSIHITYEPQSTDINVALLFIENGISVQNNLSSTSETDALSAAQGKALKDLIDTLGLADLADIDITSLTDGQILVYDSVSEKWVNTTLDIHSSLSDLDDTDIDTPINGQILQYDGSKWINASIAGGINYAKTEQNTGIKWIDGKDIYQNTFEKTLTLGSNVNLITSTDLPNVDKIIDYWGDVNGFPLNMFNSNDYRVFSYISGTNIVVNGKRGTNVTQPVTITVFYTKTS